MDLISSTTTEKDDTIVSSMVRPLLVFTILTITSVATVIGNSLVVSAIWREVGLHSPTNYFIASLAISDLLLGLVVIPFEALTELLNGRWLFGHEWCDIWRAFDVLLATSSILNLCVISLDRYWAISEPFTYPSKMTGVTAFKLILGVWCCSVGISFPAILYWRWSRIHPFPNGTCLFTDDAIYLLGSSLISFYIPLLVMLFTYFKIYRAAVRQTRSIQLGSKFVYDKELELRLRMRIHKGGGTERGSYPGAVSPQMKHLIVQPRTSSEGNTRRPRGDQTLNKGRRSLVKRKFTKFSKEKKAAKTLFIVLGVFIICWLPFFLMNVGAAIWNGCGLQQTLAFALFTYLGWLNSAMNPFIYAFMHLDFRKAFGKMLCCARIRSLLWR